MLDLIEPVRAILDQVRALTGKDFRFIEKYDLQDDLVSVRMALTNSPEHLVFFTPTADDAVNHLLAHECGRILRIYGVPPEKRVIPVITPETQALATGRLHLDIGRLYPRLLFPVAVELVGIHYRTVVRRLSGWPQDTRIESWLYADFPGLRPYQARSLKKQAEIIRNDSEQTRNSTPPRLHEALDAMSYAAYRLIDDCVHLSLHARFRHAALRYRGDELYDLTRKGYRDDYEGDVAMIDKWAALLGLTGWYAWRDIEAAAESRPFS